jgi:hypothetical protein
VSRRPIAGGSTKGRHRTAQGWALQSQTGDSAVLQRDGELMLVNVDEAQRRGRSPVSRDRPRVGRWVVREEGVASPTSDNCFRGGTVARLMTEREVTSVLRSCRVKRCSSVNRLLAGAEQMSVGRGGDRKSARQIPGLA